MITTGGHEAVYSGGSASATRLIIGGYVVISSGGRAVGDVMSGAG